jgi:hypothetical protein
MARARTSQSRARSRLSHRHWHRGRPRDLVEQSIRRDLWTRVRPAADIGCDADREVFGESIKRRQREGPTGLIATTTSLRLYPENETRMLSLTITDTRDQTAAVFRARAQEKYRAEIDLTRWQALQSWLATGPNEVVILFADRLADLVPPLAVRLRRHFKTVLMLVRAHALLHQASPPPRGCSQPASMRKPADLSCLTVPSTR